MTIDRILTEGSLFLLDRQRLVQYRRALSEQFSKVRSILIP